MLSQSDLMAKEVIELKDYLDKLEQAINCGGLSITATHANIERQELVKKLIVDKSLRHRATVNTALEPSVLDQNPQPLCPSSSEVAVPARYLQDLQLADLYLKKALDARRRGIDFSLTLSDMRRLLSLKRCQYTKIPFIEGDPKYRRSFERLDCRQGYTPDNTLVVCSMFNTLKNQLFENPNTMHPSRHELLLFAQKIVELLGDDEQAE